MQSEDSISIICMRSKLPSTSDVRTGCNHQSACRILGVVQILPSASGSCAGCNSPLKVLPLCFYALAIRIRLLCQMQCSLLGRFQAPCGCHPAQEPDAIPLDPVPCVKASSLQSASGTRAGCNFDMFYHYSNDKSLQSASGTRTGCNSPCNQPCSFLRVETRVRETPYL